MSTDISDLRTLRRYRAEREHIFPSDASLEWFARQHRRALIAAGALLVIGGRRMVDPSTFDEVVLRVGHETARHAEEAAEARP